MKSTKVVNIYPSMPITGVNPPIRSTVKRVTKSIDEIRTCLMARAVVEEILPSGEIIRLNIGNYNKCACEVSGIKCDCCKPKTDESVDETSKTPWQVAYENALAGKNLNIMSRKQRRSAEAAARAAADAAIAEPEAEVVMGVANIETVKETTETDVVEITVDEVVKTEDIVNIQEEEVKTVDVEDLAVINE